MSQGVRRIGLAATPAPWSKALRNYARDHASGIEVETLLDPRHLRRPGRLPFDVLVVDDTARIFPAAAVADAVEGGTFAVGLYDAVNGLGRQFLEGLGVQLVLPATTPPDQLIEMLTRLAPAGAEAGPADDRTHRQAGRVPATGVRPGGAGRLSAWYGTTGGCGLTEAIIAAADVLAGDRRTLVIEAEPLSASMAARLCRSPATGLSWVLGRVARGQSALPEGLSGQLEDGTRPLGRFDVICQTAVPGGPAPMSEQAVLALVEEARRNYDHVLVSTGPLVAAPSAAGKDRFAAGRALLSVADLTVAVATADPIGAVALAAWRAAADELGVDRAWAVMGRAGRPRFEQAQLAELVAGATAARPFQRLWFLPEDEAVSRARWNAGLVARGRWSTAVNRLAVALGDVDRRAGTPRVDRASGWGLVMAR